MTDLELLPRSIELNETSEPIHALDIHLRQWEWCGTVDHRAITELMLVKSFDAERAGYVRDWRFYAREETVMLDRARTYFVTPEVTANILERADAMAPKALTPGMLPSEAGFVVFGTPLPFVDYDMDIVGEFGPDALARLPLRAVMWHTTQTVTTPKGGAAPGIALWMYIDIEVALEQLGETTQLFKLSRPPLLTLDMTGWQYELDWTVGDWSVRPIDRTPGVQVPHIGGLRLNMLALWEFMSEVLTPMRPPRPQMRRWQRSGKEMPDDGTVKIIHLRKYRQLPRKVMGPHGEIEWTHQWNVRGHWRHLTRPDGTEYLTWVREHRRGPKDKPFVTKEKITSVDR